MVCSTNHIEAISRQADIEGLDQRARGELACHQHIAEKANALSRNYRLDRMQLLPEAQVLHVLEFRNVAPFAPSNGKPRLPSWRIEVGGCPVTMNEDVSPEIRNALQ